MARRNAQGFALGLGREAAAASGTLNGELQVASMLMDPIVTTTEEGVVTAFRVNGQSVMVTKEGADIRLFSPAGQFEGQRSMSLPLRAQQSVAISYELAGAGTVAACIGTDPISPEKVVPINQLGKAIDYLAGFGQVEVPNGDSDVLEAKLLRPCVLGPMCLTAESDPEDLTVQSILVNGIELLSGGRTAVGREIPIGYMSHLCTDLDGKTLGYYCEANDVITITLANYNAGNIIVRGGAFIIPESASAFGTALS